LRTTATIAIQDASLLKQQLLGWAQQFREVVFLDSNSYEQQYTSYDAILAVDALTSIQTDYYNAFDDLNIYQQRANDWLFGYLSYDLKNDTEELTSNNFDGLQFPDLFFFQPKKVFLLKENQLTLHYLNMCDDDIDNDLKEIQGFSQDAGISFSEHKLVVAQRIPKEVYLAKAALMLQHINRGDIYEANFCMEFYSEDAIIDPPALYQKLNAISQPPFAAYLKNYKHYLLSASPERYLKKQGNKIISQPIKGTARRSVDSAEDAIIRQELALNEKERSENIMIVDLVRNDLSRTAARSSVEVEELCGAYTFKQVHHLISTVVSRAEAEHSPVDIIRTTFPMGSMTGAPKISAMKIIEELEETRRGLYSGAVGYFTPDGDFDFNVVIRSILYNQDNQYVSFSVGSAITSLSDPEKEYEECLLKAKAMQTVLNS
jgi:para-aminobenzoate synthetase component 1